MGKKELSLFLSSNDTENLKCFFAAEFFDCSVVPITSTPPAASKVLDGSLSVGRFTGVEVFGANNLCRLMGSSVMADSPRLLDDVLDIEEFIIQPLLKGKQKKKGSSSSASALTTELNALEVAMQALKSNLKAYQFASLILLPALRVLETKMNDSVPKAALDIMGGCEDLGDLILRAENKLKDVKSSLSGAASLGKAPPVAIDVASDGLMNSLRKLFSSALHHAFPPPSAVSSAESETPWSADIARCGNPKFGDFQCNNAMKLSKFLKSSPDHTGPTTPKDIGSLIVHALPENDLVSEASVMPNGFINIRVATSLLIKTLANVVSHGVKPPGVTKQKVLVDFSSPNIAKEMHVGHLRSTIIGDCLCRTLEFCGHDVLRVNHVGDWGTQFGMLISYLQEKYPDIHSNPPDIGDLTKIYKAAKERFDADEDFKTLSRSNVVKLQSGDAGCNAIWKLLCDISRREFQRVYDALGIRLTEVGESFYNAMIPPVLEELTQLGLTEKEGELLLSRLPHFDIPLILRKSDGGYGYDSTDMAAIKYRLKTLDRDWLIYITDAGQMGHFHKVFDVAKKAGWTKEGGESGEKRLDFVGFGVVCGEDGKRFKTRSGETVRLIDLLNAAKDRMEVSLNNRKEEGKTNLPSDAIGKAASSIGYGAVKYFDLKQNPATNYVFNYDRMLDTKGDTAVYLLFAYARVASILRKGFDEKKFDPSSLSANDLEAKISLNDPSERALAFELLQFGEVVRSTLNELSPNKLCDYLKEVSIRLTDFVTKCHVLNSSETESRLILCESTRLVLDKVFGLLGIETLEKI